MNNLKISVRWHRANNKKSIYDRAILKEEKLLAEYLFLLRQEDTIDITEDKAVA